MTSFDDVRKAREIHENAIEAYLEAANELAKAEFDYDVIRAAATRVERDKGTPMTIIDRLVNGEDEVAKAKMQVSLCKSYAKAADSRIQATYNDLKQACIYEDRDWRQGGRGDYIA